EAADLLGQVVGDGLVLVRPEPPVILRAREERRGRALANELVELPHLVVHLSRADPEHARRAAVRRHGERDHAHAVDGSLRDRIARQLAVLRVAPGPFLAGCVLLADRERRQAVRRAADRARDEEVPPALVWTSACETGSEYAEPPASVAERLQSE